MVVSYDLLLHVGAAALVIAGAAIQVATGAGLSVVCGFFLLLWLGAAKSVPVLLVLNLLVSIIASCADWKAVRWTDVAFVSTALVAGSGLAIAVPPLSSLALTLLTAGALLAVAAPRPPAADRASPASAALIVALAGALAGALTVWTATPGPIIAVALAQAGRPGGAISRTMQPISVVGYGTALAMSGLPFAAATEDWTVRMLAIATLAGTCAGFLVRPRIRSDSIILAVRIIAALAAALLVGASLLRVAASS